MSQAQLLVFKKSMHLSLQMETPHERRAAMHENIALPIRRTFSPDSHYPHLNVSESYSVWNEAENVMIDKLIIRLDKDKKNVSRGAQMRVLWKYPTVVIEYSDPNYATQARWGAHLRNVVSCNNTTSATLTRDAHDERDLQNTIPLIADIARTVFRHNIFMEKLHRTYENVEDEEVSARSNSRAYPKIWKTGGKCIRISLMDSELAIMADKCADDGLMREVITYLVRSNQAIQMHGLEGYAGARPVAVFSFCSFADMQNALRMLQLVYSAF
jgi:hypothetical protein